jgi:hypothetical protein
MAVIRTRRQLAPVVTLRPQLAFFLVILLVDRLLFLHYCEDLGGMCVRNLCTNIVSELCDMLGCITGHFIGSADGTTNINICVNN